MGVNALSTLVFDLGHCPQLAKLILGFVEQIPGLVNTATAFSPWHGVCWAVSLPIDAGQHTTRCDGHIAQQLGQLLIVVNGK